MEKGAGDRGGSGGGERDLVVGEVGSHSGFGGDVLVVDSTYQYPSVTNNTNGIPISNKQHPLVINNTISNMKHLSPAARRKAARAK